MANNTIYPFGPGGQTPINIPIADDLNTNRADVALSAKQGKILNEVINGSPEPITVVIDGSSISSCGGTINNNKVWEQSSRWYGGVIDVQGYRGNTVGIIKNQNGNNVGYSFLTQGPTWGSSAQFATGYSAVIYSSSNVEVVVPNDAVYLYVYLNSDGTIYTPKEIDIETDAYSGGLVGDISELRKEIGGVTATINGSELSSAGATIRSSDNVWVSASGYNSSLISISDYRGKTLRLTRNQNLNQVMYTFLVAGVSVGNSAQFANGYSKVYNSPNDIDVVVPADAEYLYVYLVSPNIDFTPTKITVFLDGSIGRDVMEQTEYNAFQQKIIRGVSPKKIRACIYNIGHFSGGANKDSSITSSNYTEKLAAYKAVVDSIGADVFGVAEHSHIFGKDTNNQSVDAKDVLFGEYFPFEGGQYNYSCDALFIKTNAEGTKAVDYDCNKTATITHTNAITAKDYYFIESDLYMHGIKVKLVVTHLAFDNNRPGVLTGDEIDELISRYANYDKVILMGDWNVASFDEFNAFVTAGYTLANDGTYKTYPSTSKALDNIIVKGLTVSNPGVVSTTGLSDHIPFYCDIELNL